MQPQENDYLVENAKFIENTCYLSKMNTYAYIIIYTLLRSMILVFGGINLECIPWF